MPPGSSHTQGTPCIMPLITIVSYACISCLRTSNTKPRARLRQRQSANQTGQLLVLAHHVFHRSLSDLCWQQIDSKAFAALAARDGWCAHCRGSRRCVDLSCRFAC